MNPQPPPRLKTEAEVEKDVRLKREAEKSRRTLMAQTAYLGTLGFIFVVPVVAGAYLGEWLDSRIEGFSFSWTLSLIIIGVFVGATNVYLFTKDEG